MRILLGLILLPALAMAQRPCMKCNIGAAIAVQESIDTIRVDRITTFLCSYDTTCQSSVEFMQVGNAVLFLLVEKKPQLFIQALDSNELDITTILGELENPINDLIDLKHCYNSILAVSDSLHFREDVLNALLIAAGKGGVSLD